MVLNFYKDDSLATLPAFPISTRDSLRLVDTVNLLDIHYKLGILLSKKFH
jgi:hypothetical protein